MCVCVLYIVLHCPRLDKRATPPIAACAPSLIPIFVLTTLAALNCYAWFVLVSASLSLDMGFCVCPRWMCFLKRCGTLPNPTVPHVFQSFLVEVILASVATHSVPSLSACMSRTRFPANCNTQTNSFPHETFQGSSLALPILLRRRSSCCSFSSFSLQTCALRSSLLHFDYIATQRRVEPAIGPLARTTRDKIRRARMPTTG